MIIKSDSATRFRNEAKAQFNADDLRGAITWFAHKSVAPTKKIFMYGRYPAVSIYDTKIHIHRLLMMFWEERDLESGEYVHHIDGNPLNALRHNLEINGASEHQGNIHRGKKQTPEHIAKRINATTITRYGHSLYENPELLNKG